ncbi:MAG: hypothetical protein HYV97_08895 [Bdellovibrio sp.]|nr:hypothetical protein [Bdellovibrio sp.]
MYRHLVWFGLNKKVLWSCAFLILATLPFNPSYSREVAALSNPSIDSWALRPSYGEGALLGYYDGPLWPKVVTDRKHGPIALSEDNFEIVTKATLDEINRLEAFWFLEFPDREICPDEMLNEHAEFLQYLFRLISLSYVYEALKDIHVYLAKLGTQEKCSISSMELWGKCHSNDVEMSKFIKRAMNDQQTDLVDKLSFPRQKKALADWWERELHQLKDQNVSSAVSISTMLLRTSLNKTIQPTQSWAVQNLSEQCKKIKSDLRLICSGKDLLYGMSSVKEARLLIERSHAFAQVNKTGYGAGCLRRFVDLFQRLEKPIFYFPDLFPAVMSTLVREDAPYLQGKLFLLGSLQEFEQKGLAGLLYQDQATPTPVPTPVAKKVTIIPKSTPTPTPTPAVAVIPTPTPKPVPKVAQFELAVRERIQFDSEKVPVNMVLMRTDYPFSDKMIVALSEPIKNFQTRKAIRDMKELDHLGSREEPVHLMFLKFLIDNDYHQGLFNFQAEIGNKFWVINDFEKNVAPQWIELINDSSTQSRWQIYILKPPK